MKIIIDAQGLQSESRKRGIGRYSMNFILALIKENITHEIIIALNASLKENLVELRNLFLRYLPHEQIIIWSSLGNTREIDPSNQKNRIQSELIREAFLYAHNPDLILITSIFEGFVDDAITSIGLFDKKTPIAIIAYDLIPKIYPEEYLFIDHNYETYYNRKLSIINRANIVFCISESTKKEFEQHIKFNPTTKIVNISAGLSDSIKPREQNNFFDEKTLRSSLGIDQQYFLFVGSADKRKNVETLIYSYSQLPDKIINQFVLIIVGNISIGEQKHLLKEIELTSIRRKIIFKTNIDDSNLYYFYKFSFLVIFPSLHEGFGLPVLEAMTLGTPVICSNRSSLPEVILNKQATFDPLDLKEMNSLILKVVNSPNFRNELIQKGLSSSSLFSWKKTAEKALFIIDDFANEQLTKINTDNVLGKIKIAFFSPLPYAKTGIALYSQELLVELIKYYDIDVIVEQKEPIECNDKVYQIKSLEYFDQNHKQYKRIIYQLGNSPYHQYMLNPLEEHSGIVVLHDFFLSSLWAPEKFSKVLFNNYGFQPFLFSSDVSRLKIKYPSNKEVINNSAGLITHSDHSKELLQKHFSSINLSISKVPLLKSEPKFSNKFLIKKSFGFTKSSFIISSFGFVDKTKMNLSVLKAFLLSKASKNTNTYFLFVGAIEGGDYGKKLLESIKSSSIKNRIIITGWVNQKDYLKYLNITDIAVQLRQDSRGETSASTLDCLSYGISTIINNHGSQKEIPDDISIKLNENPTLEDITEAIDNTYDSSKLRNKLGEKAKQYITNNHSPQQIALKYYNFIEGRYKQSFRIKNLITELNKNKPTQLLKLALSDNIAHSFPKNVRRKQILLDITATINNGLKTGIERLSISVVYSFIKANHKNIDARAIYLKGEKSGAQYYYANCYTAEYILQKEHLISQIGLIDRPINFKPGDIILTLDLSGDHIISAKDYLDDLFNRGVQIYFTIFDLLPIQLPQYFPNGTNDWFEKWLYFTTNYNGVLCISKSVSKSYKNWILSLSNTINNQFKISYFHLGADLKHEHNSKGITKKQKKYLNKIESQLNFLVVGTIEPRKAHLLILNSFEKLWIKGIDVHLTLVGREGWQSLSKFETGSIKKTIKKLNTLKKQNFPLKWINDASDEYLQELYAVSNCLIFASYGEGFGLPIVEAAKIGIPIIARDLEVFKEIANENIYYFDRDEDNDISANIQSWINLYNKSKEPKSHNITIKTWEESVNKIISELI